jgi:hypothetical protein
MIHGCIVPDVRETRSFTGLPQTLEQQLERTRSDMEMQWDSLHGAQVRVEHGAMGASGRVVEPYWHTEEVTDPQTGEKRSRLDLYGVIALDDPKTSAQAIAYVEAGALRELSLSDVLFWDTEKGVVTGAKTREVTLCVKGARDGSMIKSKPSTYKQITSRASYTMSSGDQKADAQAPPADAAQAAPQEQPEEQPDALDQMTLPEFLQHIANKRGELNTREKKLLVAKNRDVIEYAESMAAQNEEMKQQIAELRETSSITNEQSLNTILSLVRTHLGDTDSDMIDKAELEIKQNGAAKVGGPFMMVASKASALAMDRLRRMDMLSSDPKFKEDLAFIGRFNGAPMRKQEVSVPAKASASTAQKRKAGFADMCTPQAAAQAGTKAGLSSTLAALHVDNSKRLKIPTGALQRQQERMMQQQ